MVHIRDVRQQFPEYDDLSDDQLLSGLHQKFYSDVPKEEFLSKIDFREGTTGERARSRAWEQTKGLVKEGIPAMVGAAMDDPEYRDKKLSEYAEREARTQRFYPADIPSFTDIKGLGDAGTYIWEAVNEGLVSMGPPLALGGVGGVGAKFIATKAGQRVLENAVRQGATREAAEAAVARAADRAVKAGIAGGAGVASAAQNVPETFVEATDGTDVGAALVGGGLKTALDVVPQMRLLGNLFGREVAEKALLKRIGKEAAKNFGLEGATEAAQETTDLAVEQYLDKRPDLFSSDALVRALDAGLKGGIAGGVAGGASATFQRSRPADPVSTPTVPENLTPQEAATRPIEFASQSEAALPVAERLPEETDQRIDEVEQAAKRQIEEAVAEVETAPTEAQKEAGNYRKGHLKLQGLDIAIENPEGSVRSGKDGDGNPWQVEMPAHYGYVKRSTGKDGDQVDVYVGGFPQSDLAVVVDQYDPKTGRFDEHKVILGVASHRGALDIYDRAFSDGSGPQRRKEATPISVDEFKQWLKEGDTTKPFAEAQPRVGELGQDVLPPLRSVVRDAAREVLGPELSKRVRIVDSIDRPDLVGDLSKNPNAKVVGLYEPGKKLISIALSQPAETLGTTVHHEAFHMLEDMKLFTPDEMQVLTRDAPAMKSFLRGAAKEMGGSDLNVDSLDSKPQELRAYAFEAYTALRNKNARTPNLTGRLRRLFERGYQFFRKLANGLRRNGSFQSYADVFKKTASGEVAARSDGNQLRESNADPALARVADDVKAAFAGDKGDPVAFAADIGIFEKLFNHPTFLANKYPALRPLVGALGKIRAVRSRMLHGMQEDFRPFMELPADGRLRVESVADLFNQSKTEPRMAGGQIVAPDGTVLKGAEAKALMGIRKGLNGVWDSYVEAMKKSLGGDIDPALLSELQKRKDSGYLPQMRFGKIGFRVVDKSTGEVVWFQTIDQSPVPGQMGRNITARKVNAIRSRLKKEKFADATFEVEPAFELTRDSWKDKNLLDAVGLVEATMMAFNLGKDTDTAAVLDDIQKQLKKRGFKAHLAERRNIPGYINDENRGSYLSQALPTYAARSSHFISREMHADELRQAAAATKGLPKLKKYAEDLISYSSSPNEEQQFLKNLAFHWLLGANISSAAINLTQVMHATLPYLSMVAGPGRAAKETSRAFKDALSVVNLLKVSEGGIDWQRKPSGVSAEEWQAMQRAHEEGLLFPVNTQELTGLAQRDYGSFIPTIGVKGVKTMEYLMLAFNTVENINRITTWLAARRLAADPAVRAKSEKTLSKSRWAGEQKTPDLLAKAAVEDTQFVMGRENRPEFMRGMMALPTQFMSFPVQMLEQWIMAAKYYGGDGVFSTGPGKTMLALMALGVMSTAGIWGLPFAEPVKKAVEQIYRMLTGKRLDVDKELREALVEAGLDKQWGEAISKGLGRLAGIDISKRTSLDIVPTNLFSGNARDMLGPTGAVTLGSLADALERFKQGQNLLGFGALMPTFLKNAITARENLRQGVITGQGNVLIPPGEVGPGQALTKGVLGFTPAKEAQARELVGARQGLTQDVKDLRESYTDRLVKARREAQLASGKNDQAAFKEAMAEFQRLMTETRDYDRKRKPVERLNINTRTVGDRVKRDLAGLASKDNVKKMAKNARAAAKELSNIYPGGTND
jgi:hypothetical protein